MIANASEIRFRCSGLGHIMTEPKEKSPKEKLFEARTLISEKELEYSTLKNRETKTAAKLLEQIEKLGSVIEKLKELEHVPFLSETCKTHLVDLYASARYGRREEVKNKFLEKGNEREQDAITLVARHLKRMFKKNSTRLTNDFITGEWDLDIKRPDGSILETLDTKTSWSLHTFLRARHKALDSDYEWQGHGYMDLTGAVRHTVCYCLVNGTAKHILQEKKKLAYQFDGVNLDNDPDYRKAAAQIEINHIFDSAAFIKENPGFQFHGDIESGRYDIPATERIFQFIIERDQQKINAMHKRAGQCREWMNQNLFKPEVTALLEA